MELARLKSMAGYFDDGARWSCPPWASRQQLMRPLADKVPWVAAWDRLMRVMLRCGCAARAGREGVREGSEVKVWRGAGSGAPRGDGAWAALLASSRRCVSRKEGSVQHAFRIVRARVPPARVNPPSCCLLTRRLAVGRYELRGGDVSSRSPLEDVFLTASSGEDAMTADQFEHLLREWGFSRCARGLALDPGMQRCSFK
jgi:hypothetical protein